MAAPSSALRIPHSPRVLVIGLDGATYDVLVPLAEAGVMPNLATLLRESALHELRSTEPYTTPVAWTSFLTGCDVASHGIWDYRYLDHARGELRLNHAGRIACPTLFHEVAAGGGQVVSLSLPMTYPAPAGVPGIVVGGLDSPSGEATLRPYPHFAERLRAMGVEYSLETIWKRKPRRYQELAAGVARTIDEFDDHVAAARIADELTDWRLMVVQFQTLDSLQHRCWHLLTACHSERPSHSERPRHSERSEESPAAPPETLRRAQGDNHAAWVREAHRAMEVLDHCIGQLIELADRRRAAVVVLGDHGFGPFREKICVNEVLRQRGLQRLASRATAWRHRAARTAWKLRKWLHRRTQEGSTAGLRRPLEALAPVDWRRTAALAVHGELSALVYLNDVARFGRGPIAAPRQREQAEADTLAAFREVRHPTTGEALFEDVYATRERFDCDTIARGWPDVVAIPAPGFHTRSKFDTAGHLLFADPTLTGTHRRETVLMIRAPSVAAAGTLGGRQVACHSERSEESTWGTRLACQATDTRAACPTRRPVVEMRDVAPTILGLLGQPPGKHMTGRCLTDSQAIAAGVEVRHHRTSKLAARADATPAGQGEDSQGLAGQDHRLVEDRLRDLGYLE